MVDLEEGRDRFDKVKDPHWYWLRRQWLKLQRQLTGMTHPEGADMPEERASAPPTAAWWRASLCFPCVRRC